MRRWLLLFTLTVPLLCAASPAAGQGAEEAQGQAAEKAGQLTESVRSLRLYLLAAPEAEAQRRMTQLSGVALFEYAMTSSFAMVDGRWVPCPVVPAYTRAEPARP